MSTNDHHSEYGFFVRIGLHGALVRGHAQDPVTAVQNLLHKGVSVHDKDRAWVWRAAPMRPDLYDATRPVRAGAFGPVGDPLVFDVGLEVLELAPPSDDPDEMLDEMLTESDKTDRAAFPKAPHLTSCSYDANMDVFRVAFVDGRREELSGARIKLLDGTPVPPGAIRGCEIDEFRRGVLVELADGSQTSFSADLVLYETDVGIRGFLDEASKAIGPLHAEIVHVVVDLRAVCGFNPGIDATSWAEVGDGHHSWCSLEEAPEKATCPRCRAACDLPEVTKSAQPDTSSEEADKARKGRIEQEINRLRNLPVEKLRLLAVQTARAIWEAVEDLERVPEGLSPAKIVDHHLRWGRNLRKEGR